MNGKNPRTLKRKPPRASRLSAASLILKPASVKSAFLASLSEAEAAALLADWDFWARPEQRAPRGDWRLWVFMGGRGAGKTRAGAEAVAKVVREGKAARIALIAATQADAREVMVEGVSGLLRIDGGERPEFEVSRRRLLWRNGAVAQLFSAEEPDSLRGPQFDYAWADEFAKWRYPQEAFDMLQLGLRLGERPRAVITTTPRNIRALKNLLEAPGTVVTRAGTMANRANLSPSFLAWVKERYRGTRLARQEIDGDLLEDTPGALWTRAMLDAARVRDNPPLTRIVIGVDPPASSGEEASETGIIAAGKGEDGRYYVLADRSAGGLSPQKWAARTIETFRMFAADRIVIEVNQGGEMVESVLRQVDPSVPVTSVRASRGKIARAEPIAALYEQGRVSHVGSLALLEDQMCAAVSGEGEAQESPDRLDALVWALSDLSAPTITPRLRRL
ncbi:MAG: DNA-packaging protein [Alphaproteobacteria bacterium]|nr:DNA-packaging protein [Alphaproteobacteria bacterium]